MAAPTIDRLKATGIAVGSTALVLLIIVIAAWNSLFHYVQPGEVLVVISKSGTELPPGELIAQPGQKGPLADVLGEGRHLVWPVLYETEVRTLAELNMEIKPLQIGVVRSKVGTQLPEGRILADKGERGVLREVLPPGRHRLNPYAFDVEIAPATVISPGFVGFVTRLVGTLPKSRFAEPGEKGILSEVLQPGIYYLNPYEFRVREVEVGLNQISFLKDDQIQFPSKDAFGISLDATVEWELKPESVAMVIDEFGARTEIEQKVLIAQSRSIGRLEGSRYGAKDFLLGAGREQIQQAFTQRLVEKCREKHVEVHSAYIRQISIPDNLLVPIRQSFVAKEKERTAKVQEETRRSAAALEREERLIEQRRQEVKAETQALVKQIAAEADRTIEEIYAETRRLVAEKQKEIAKLDAQRTELLGKAQAEVTRMQGEAKAGRFALKVGAFDGDSKAFARYAFAEALPEDLQVRLVETGEGTFWTDLDTAAGVGPALGKLLKESGPKKK